MENTLATLKLEIEERLESNQSITKTCNSMIRTNHALIVDSYKDNDIEVLIEHFLDAALEDKTKGLTKVQDLAFLVGQISFIKSSDSIHGYYLTERNSNGIEPINDKLCCKLSQDQEELSELEEVLMEYIFSTGDEILDIPYESNINGYFKTIFIGEIDYHESLDGFFFEIKSLKPVYAELVDRFYAEIQKKKHKIIEVLEKNIDILVY